MPVSPQIVDIPVRSGGLHGSRLGQVPTASSSSPGAADEAFKGFSLFHRSQKSAQSARRSSAGVVAHSSSRTPAACEPEESLSEGQYGWWDDEYGRMWIKTAAFPGRWYLMGPAGTGTSSGTSLVRARGVPGERHGVRLLLPGS